MNKNKSRFEVHSHLDYSNLRLVDSINKAKPLIERAVELGLSGIAITDHETLAGHIEVNKIALKLNKTNPDFKVALGNEIYLTETRESSQRYYHFILIAKNKTGHKMLRELSSTACLNSYHDRGMERVPTLKSELSNVIAKYGKGNLIATSACLGGELSVATLKLVNAEIVEDNQSAQEAHSQIVNFILFCKDLFEEDFYIECAPGLSRDQLKVNRRLVSIASCFNIKMVMGSDAHFIKKEDRFVHKAYLNSKQGDREVDDFYEYCYLMTEEEAKENIENVECLNYDTLVKNSLEIYEKIENYSLLHKQTIPEIEVKDYKKLDVLTEYPTLHELFKSDNPQERYWVNECCNVLKEKMLWKEEYKERLETEADIIKYTGDQLEQCLFSYFNTFQHYIDLFWECGSIVGPGRGSSTGFLSNWCLGITQLDPIKWNLQYWRFLNKGRVTLPDIDIDLSPLRRPTIFKKIREERGELGVVQVCAFGTEGTKSTVQTACRGYRTEDFPDGIDVDTAQYISSLIPTVRGFLWPLKDVVNGNTEENRKPIKPFIKEVEKYPGLLDIMLKIEGLVNKKTVHASGVLLLDNNDPYEFCCLMKAPGGDIITQYDLESVEPAGLTKYDFLVTKVIDKMISNIDLLKNNELLPKEESLKETYNNLLHPDIIDIDSSEIWKSLGEGSVLDCFQFSSGTGLDIAKRIKPEDIIEMTLANALMRLMGEKGQESPADRFLRLRNNMNLWYKEMKDAGLSDEEMKFLEPHYLEYYGCILTQERMMEILMDPNIAGFTLVEADTARKTVAKKLMDKIPALKEMFYSKFTNMAFANYVWDTAVKPSLMYSFSLLHSLPYSFVGVQTLNLATKFNPIYWNTACLLVNSGSIETEESKSTDYGRIARAIGEITSRGIKVSLIDINRSQFGFYPDIENNEILFGLKGVNGIGDDVAEKIISNRPYNSMVDFMNKTKLNRSAMVQLIKSGAFDKLEKIPRQLIMGNYIWITCGKKTKLNLQNFSGLINANLIPDALSYQVRVFNFTKYIKKFLKSGEYYILDNSALNFIAENYDSDHLFIQEEEVYKMPIDKWESIYQSEMDVARDWIKSNLEETLDKFNSLIFYDDYLKYGKGSISSWEMESLCFYHTSHELKDIDVHRYGISSYSDLPAEPIVEKWFKRNKMDLPIYKLYKIIGTVIDKNKTKSTLSLLTVEGEVVEVKFTNEYFSMFDKQISEKREDGTKKIVEKSWFKRGSMIMVTGYRRDDRFFGKTYANTPTHQLYKIIDIKNDGRNLELSSERYNIDE